jgi:hypothetical protein
VISGTGWGQLVSQTLFQRIQEYKPPTIMSLKQVDKRRRGRKKNEADEKDIQPCVSSILDYFKC